MAAESQDGGQRPHILTAMLSDARNNSMLKIYFVTYLGIADMAECFLGGEPMESVNQCLLSPIYVQKDFILVNWINFSNSKRDCLSVRPCVSLGSYIRIQETLTDLDRIHVRLW